MRLARKSRGPLVALCALAGCGEGHTDEVAATTGDEPNADPSYDASVPPTDADVEPEMKLAVEANLGGGSGASELFAAAGGVCWLDATRTQVSCSGLDREAPAGSSNENEIAASNTTTFTLGAKVQQIALGSHHGCALLGSIDPMTQVVCWGENSVGQLGVGDTTERPPWFT